MNYKIASHVLGIRGAQLAYNFQVFGTDEPSEWRLLFGQKTDIRGELLHEFTMDDGQTRCTFLRDGDSRCFTLGDGLGMRYDGTDTVKISGRCDPRYIHFAIWLAFSLLAINVKATPVHASTIVRNGKAVMFLGESGTGKSTHTGLWLKNIPGTVLLNDDSPILSVESGTPLVYGSPWSGKTPCYKTECHPLAAIVRLRQAKTNEITRLDTMGAFAALFPSCPPSFAKDSELTDKVVDIVSQTISNVPVYTLDCLPDEEAAQLSCRTIFGQ